MPKRDLSPARPGQVTHGAGEIPITKTTGTGEHQHVVRADEALPADKPASGRRLGQVLVSEGSISEDQLARALAAQRPSFAPLGALLVNQGALPEDSLTQALSGHLAARMDDLKTGEVDP